MKKAFPGQPIGFGYGLEGPITTAWELRGEEFFSDLYDNPDGMQEFLTLVNASIQEFYGFQCSLYNSPIVNPDGCWMADDVAAMIPPNLWSQYVVPYWEQYYLGKTTGPRSVHVEDLKPNHLKFLEELDINLHDPCMSPKLSPQIICSGNKVPFQWSLLSFHFDQLTIDNVRDFVFHAAADGASQVCVGLEWGMFKEETLQKVKAFIDAGKTISQMIKDGTKRGDLVEMIS